jgi:Domain of unknown function (DUF1707)
MSPSSSQQWRRVRYSDAHLRVSDADRNAVTERLAAHYGDGRLDQAEFDERVSRAMTAKTRGDLDGLFDDLPDHPEPAGASGTGGPLGPAVPYRVHRHRGPARPILLVALVIALMIAVGHAFTALYIPWFWVAVIVVAIIVTSRSARTRNDR